MYNLTMYNVQLIYFRLGDSRFDRLGDSPRVIRYAPHTGDSPLEPRGGGGGSSR